MKIAFKSITILLLFVTVLTSCGSDDGPSVPPTILAKWTPNRSVLEANGSRITTNYDDNVAGCDKNFVEFTAANVFRNVVFFKNASNVCAEDEADPTTYTLTDDNLVIAGGLYGGNYTIFRLTNNELAIRNTETISGVATTVTIYFTKVP
jgi:hypothetical protein